MIDDPHTEIPDKLFFRIGEVSQLVGVEAYVLRYWESEFKGLSPKKSDSGQRMFRRKELLYERKFTIEGARKALAESGKQGELPKQKVNQSKAAAQEELFPRADPLPHIRREVAEILKLLS